MGRGGGADTTRVLQMTQQVLKTDGVLGINTVHVLGFIKTPPAEMRKYRGIIRYIILFYLDLIHKHTMFWGKIIYIVYMGKKKKVLKVR